MNNTYLEQLKKKPIPKTITNGAISIRMPMKDDIIKPNINMEDKSEPNVIEDNRDINQPQTHFKIIDKRNESNIDRKLILERLYNRGVMNFEELEQSDDSFDIETTKKPTKKKRIIISENQIDKTFDETEPDNIQTKPVKSKKIKAKTVSTTPLYDYKIGEKKISERLPASKAKVLQRSSTYYMNNRKLYIDKINQLFRPYKQEIEDTIASASCKSKEVDFELLTHQKVVRDYLNLYTPYRGLLLYHGLGSGKTCTSIGIAEGMKTDKHVILMTPASLKMNFFSELKKCGDELFRKNQYWEFISTVGRQDLIDSISGTMGISKEFIEKYNGAWMIDVSKPSNYKELTANERATLDIQLNEMIRHKYTDLNYNGLNMNILNDLTHNQTINPFDNKVIIIDEAHNFVSRIVNKINKPGTISYILYDLLMSAQNARIVLLTGTPIINYPNEIGILYNLLRGYIKTWKIPITVKSSKKINRDEILKMFQEENFNTHDYVEYSGNVLTITRNPYGFINIEKRNYVRKDETQKKRYGGINSTKKNKLVIQGGNDGPFDKYKGVKLDDTGNLTDHTFINTITRILSNNELEPQTTRITLELNKALPDIRDEFIDMFIDTDSANVKDTNLFKRRILGLTSYFRSASEKLLPSFIINESGGNYHIVANEMSDYQFSKYEKIRKDEAEQEKRKRIMSKKKKPNDELFEIASSYRIFSRAACNYVFPEPPGRPMPNRSENDTIDEVNFDAVPNEQIMDADVYSNQEDIEQGNIDDNLDYSQRIQNALKFLSDNASDYLTPKALEIYSPKFLSILSNLTNPEYTGLHLIYSQFRTIEGIGIMKLVLEANGFAHFKIKKKSEGEWTLDMRNNKKPKFILYTGTETAEEKEILRNIYNSQWEFIPTGLREEIEKIHDNNLMGEVIKIIMITSSGAEGINLRNTRYTHIIEPYWNMGRIDQVVGRARRICSHEDLPENLRNVQVFIYLTTFSEKQSTDNNNKELIIRDISKLDNKTPITTDESLYEIARIKDNINQQLLTAVKESAIDCSLYSKNSSENLVCYGYGKVMSNQFASYPSLDVDKFQKDDVNVKKQSLHLRKITIQGKEYAYDQQRNIVYDMDSYKRSKKTGETMDELGRLKKEGRNNVLVKF
jgi:hypothetical protein